MQRCAQADDVGRMIHLGAKRDVGVARRLAAQPLGAGALDGVVEAPHNAAAVDDAHQRAARVIAHRGTRGGARHWEDDLRRRRAQHAAQL